ncbi:MAG: SMC-Scp complex subunit ScpB [Planctomycetales bacterium]|nr:SMC-Scp complex subunit ScpB [Planctomycetales bacterium]
MDDSQDDAELDPAEAELEDEEGFTLEELSQAYLGIVGGVSENSGPLHESDNEIEIFEDEKVDEDQDRYQVTPQNILEAILFVARPDDTHVGIQEITSVMRGVTEEDVLHWVDQLNAIYEETGSAIHIQQSPQGLAFQLVAGVQDIQEQFYGHIKELKLNQAAIDCLALVAYQPGISREQIDGQRGQSSSGVLNQLVRRQLLEIRRQVVGKTKQAHYFPTAKLLELVGLGSLDDLPHVEEWE